jgi:hypothetical protein
LHPLNSASTIKENFVFIYNPDASVIDTLSDGGQAQIGGEEEEGPKIDFEARNREKLRAV